MIEIRHKLRDKSRVCEVEGCDEEAVRSVSVQKASAVISGLSGGRGKVHLCRRHYRQFKKGTKVDRTLERLCWQS